MLRDKSYLRLNNNMLLNVTGDEHVDGRVYASLKYVGKRKWTQGYQAAVRYLMKEDPTLVDGEGFISIPRVRIAEVLDPFERWAELHQAIACGPLHREAMELAKQLNAELGLTDFGITDSLLWGDGHVDSDIDLVVRGRRNAMRFLEQGEVLYESSDFVRASPQRLLAPYGLDVPEWPRILRRKVHMGSFRGRLFSVRVVLHENEIDRQLWRPTASARKVEFHVADHTDGLSFPAIYRDDRGHELVDYSVVYEGVFRRGDRVDCACEQLTSADRSQPPRHRYVIQRVKRFVSKTK